MASMSDGTIGSNSAVQYKKISSKIIPGILHAQNKGALDWGWQGLLAYGCQHVVVVVDCYNVQILQTLDKHQSAVTRVKWPHESYYHKQIYPFPLKLATSDSAGNIVIWNVRDSKVICELSDGNRPVLELSWLSPTLTEGSYDLLAVLHPPYSFILWNTQTGTKLWKKSYTESLLGFSFDPFCLTNLAFLGHDCVVLVEDFTLNKVPSSNGRKFYVSSPSTLATSTTNLANLDNEDKGRGREKIRKKVRLLGGTDSRNSKSEDSPSMSECISLCYHSACRHHLLLVYPREVLILDLEINQTIGIITADRNSSPFVQVTPLRQRDAVCALHENGMISLHCCQSLPEQVESSGNMSQDTYVELTYDIQAQSDPIRFTKLHRVTGFTVCPRSESSVALLISDGRILTLDLKPRHQSVLMPTYTLSDLLSPVSPCKKKGGLLKFVVTGLLQTAAASPLVIRMCPPLTTKNWTVYQPWMAAGATSGVIQIFDMAAGMLHKELSVHTYPVRGIEWISLTSFLSYAHQNVSNSTGQVRNELYLTDVQTGKSKMFRAETQEESPVDMVRVSYLKQYFIIAFKDDPFELWDIRSLTLLRAMNRHFPVITALEWAPVHNLRSMKKKLAQVEASSMGSSTTSVLSPLGSAEPTTTTHPSGILVRETFVFTDTDGHIYHFNVEGSVIKDGSKIPPDSSMGSITSISWKNDQLVLADVDGNLTLWDLKSNFLNVMPTHRGWIKRIRFAPGRGNMKMLILYNDGIDIWDIREMSLLGQIKSAKEMPRVEDADWAASDKPVLATSDGCLRIMDLSLMGTSSPITERECLATFWCPALLPSAAQIRTHLLHGNSMEFSFDSLKDLSKSVPADQQDLFTSHIKILDRDFKDILSNECPLKTVHLYFTIARLLGDEGEMMFWQVAQHYLKLELKSKRDPAVMSNLDCFYCQAFSLDRSYDVLCDTNTYKKLQLERLALHESKQTNHELASKCADTLILLQETDRAVQHLLETDPSSDSFYVDCLRACIVASIQTSGMSQSTIKLVATNLIANGYIAEGVQLLCLIGKGADACRYLQTYGKWEKAMWIAKCALNESECLEVARRWTDYLISPAVNQKGKATLVLLSMHQFTKVLELLHSWRYVDRAALFGEVCEDLKVLQNNEATTYPHQLLKDVYLKYARALKNDNNSEVSTYYAAKSGVSDEFDRPAAATTM